MAPPFKVDTVPNQSLSSPPHPEPANGYIFILSAENIFFLPATPSGQCMCHSCAEPHSLALSWWSPPGSCSLVEGVADRMGSSQLTLVALGSQH